MPLLQLHLICFALSFMETLGQGGAGTCKRIDFLWHKPTAPCQNNEFLSTPHHHRERMWFYMQSEPEVCADSGGGRALFTFHPAVLELFVFFSWAPVLLPQDRGDHGYTPMALNAWCTQEKWMGRVGGALECSNYFGVFRYFTLSPSRVYILTQQHPSNYCLCTETAG